MTDGNLVGWELGPIAGCILDGDNEKFEDDGSILDGDEDGDFDGIDITQIARFSLQISHPLAKNTLPSFLIFWNNLKTLTRSDEEFETWNVFNGHIFE